MSMISELTVGQQRFIQLENSRYEVLISLYGAQVLAMQPKDGGADWFWMSQAKALTIGEAVRGGIPICWPNFGVDEQAKLPKHGFARLQNWSYKGELEDVAGDSVSVSFRLRDNDFSRKYWAYAFELELAVRLSGDGLELELTTTNNDVQSFSYSQALHPYFAVSDLANITIEGLAGASYVDVLTGLTQSWSDNISYDQRIEAIFKGHDAELVLKDSKIRSTLTVDKAGFSDWVLWNPHAVGSNGVVDLAEQAYRQFICLEPAISESIVLAPNEQYTARMVIKA